MPNEADVNVDKETGDDGVSEDAAALDSSSSSVVDSADATDGVDSL